MTEGIIVAVSREKLMARDANLLKNSLRLIHAFDVVYISALVSEAALLMVEEVAATVGMVREHEVLSQASVSKLAVCSQEVLTRRLLERRDVVVVLGTLMPVDVLLLALELVIAVSWGHCDSGGQACFMSLVVGLRVTLSWNRDSLHVCVHIHHFRDTSVCFPFRTALLVLRTLMLLGDFLIARMGRVDLLVRFILLNFLSFLVPRNYLLVVESFV